MTMKKILIVSSLSLLLLTGCAKSYYLENVEVVEKEVQVNNTGYPTYLIHVKKGEKEGILETDSSDYTTIKVGQYINGKVKGSKGYLKNYQVNMEGKTNEEETKTKSDAHP